MILKVCGMGDAEVMHQLAKLNIDMLGFIFYPRSPRYVVGKVDPEAIKSVPGNIEKIGVFVNEKDARILELAEEYGLTGIQLHGSERGETCTILKEKGLVVIKAFNLAKENRYEEYATCDFFLFDTPSEEHGGTGQKFDWSLLEKYTYPKPFLLSGGIGPDDAEEIKKIKHDKLVGIDINSKFETKPGVKNAELIRSFLEKIITLDK